MNIAKFKLTEILCRFMSQCFESYTSDLLIFNGKLKSLSFNTCKNKVEAQVCQFTLVTEDDAELKFASLNLLDRNKKQDECTIYIRNINQFQSSIQDCLDNENVAKILIKDQHILDIVVTKEQKIIQKHKEIKLKPNHLPQTDFPIHIRCADQLASLYQDAFDEAAARWSEIIVGGSPQIRTSGDITKGIVIKAFTSQIDGAGSILGGAGPVEINVGQTSPATGWMLLDSKDMHGMNDRGILVDTILHEIGHILGFGTLWNQLGLLRDLGADSPVFVGKNSMREYAKLKRLNQLEPVPIENEGKQGIKDCHWRESIFGDELMTSCIGGKNPISRLTIASLKDIGYQVKLDAANSYYTNKKKPFVVSNSIHNQLNFSHCATY